MPRCDPPFDDELEPHVWAVGGGQLALEWPARPAPPASRPGPEVAAALRRPCAPARPGPPGAAPAEPDRTAPGRWVPAGASGDAKLAVRRFVHMCVEVLNGYRPAAHLRRLALPKEAAGVVAQAVAGTGRVAELRRETRPGPRRDRRPGPVGVIRLRLCEPRPGAVEAAVLLVTGDRTWAMALRLELHEQSWRATTLRLI